MREKYQLQYLDSKHVFKVPGISDRSEDGRWRIIDVDSDTSFFCIVGPFDEKTISIMRHMVTNMNAAYDEGLKAANNKVAEGTK